MHVRHLYESLAVGACSHYHGAVEILERSARYLAGACRCFVHKYDDRHYRVYRFHGGLIRLVGTLHLAFHREQLGVFRDEYVQHRQRFLHRAAAVVAQVYHQAFRSLLLQVDERAAEILCAVLADVRVEVYIAYVACLHAVVLQIGHLNGLALYFESHVLVGGRTVYLQLESGACVAAQMLADVCVGLVGHVLAVDA